MSDWSGHCAEPVAEEVRARSGRDVWAELGGCPRSWREAAALYRRLGVTTLADAVTKALGAPLSSTRKARRGDAVMVRGALGVCAGDVAVCSGATVPMREADKAWPSTGGDHRQDR